MAAEEVKTLRIPLIGEVEVDDASGLAFLVVSLVAGSTVYHMTDSIGSNLGSAANSFIAQFTGINPSGGSSVPEGV